MRSWWSADLTLESPKQVGIVVVDFTFEVWLEFDALFQWVVKCVSANVVEETSLKI